MCLETAYNRTPLLCKQYCLLPNWKDPILETTDIQVSFVSYTLSDNYIAVAKLIFMGDKLNDINFKMTLGP